MKHKRFNQQKFVQNVVVPAQAIVGFGMILFAGGSDCIAQMILLGLGGLLMMSSILIFE